MKLRVAMFYHSLVSDWNHGNAHFLRGVASELQARGHDVRILEPEDSWSRANLTAEYGFRPVAEFERAFPSLTSTRYDPASFDPGRWLDSADLAIVHEWNHPRVIGAIGDYRRRNSSCKVLFHDTHHRALTARHELAQFDLASYDGVLAYGASLKQTYERLGWGKQVHVWHEAADIRTFYPRMPSRERSDIVWIGNWGDDERTEELREYFIRPVKSESWKAEAYGVRYAQSALDELRAASIAYRGWLPNFEVPATFSNFKATVHIPRRPYTQQLPGIPTIRPFEALACGIPLVSAPWQDTEGLFRVGSDFLMAQNGEEMRSHLRSVLNDPALAASLSASGLETIRSRHTCAHRVDELLHIYSGLCSNAVRQEPRIEVEMPV